MQTLGSDLEGLRKQLEDGSVQRAYVAILGYMSRLRAWFASGRPDQMVSDLYQGVFDMTYFALTPPALTARELITVDDIANGLELEHPERLTAEIESAVSAFGVEVERFLADCDPRSV
jgi:hypothetical protein